MTRIQPFNVLPAAAAAELTGRERQVLALLAQGLSQTEVADRIFRSVHTVSFHLRNCQQKLAARNSTQAVAIALSQGQIELVWEGC